MNPARRAIAAAAALSALASVAHAQCANPNTNNGLLNLLPHGEESIAAVQSGPWSDPDTWGGALPIPADNVLIPAGVSVTYDVFDDGDGQGPDTTRFHFVRVDGELHWARDRDTRLFVDTLFTAPGSLLTIGDVANPIPAQFTAEIVIIADEPMTQADDPASLSRGIVPHGTNRIVGADKADFAALQGDALAGETTLTLREAPQGWQVGDTLVLGGTFYDASGDDADNSRFHDEVLAVTAINGAEVTFTNTAPGFAGLRWDHARPSGHFFDASDLTLYVANLTRNITFRSELDPNSPEQLTPSIPFPNGIDTPIDPATRQRGHFMAMHSADTVTMNAAFVDFGRLDKSRFIDDAIANTDGTLGNGANPRGRYAYHLHRNLPQSITPIDFDNPACAPAIVRGNVVSGSPGWGFVHHDSWAVFEDNVAFDVLGAAFVQEAGNEIGLWRNNISIKTTGDEDPDLTVEPFGDGFKRVTNFDFGFNGEAYWIQGASQVEVIDCIAISAAGGGVDIFSDVDGNENRDRGFVPTEHLPLDRQHIVTNGNAAIAGNRVPTNTFSGFTVYNSDFGLITWNHMRNQGEWTGYTCPCDGNTHREYALIDNFTFWNIYGQGVHLQYSSQIELRNGLIASSDLATPGIDDKPALDLSINGDGRGYGLGMNGPTKRLIVNNVAIEGWLFGLRTPLEGAINNIDLAMGEGTGSEGSLGLPARRSTFIDLRMANNTNHLFRRQNGFTQTQPFPNNLEIIGGQFITTTPNTPPVADFTDVSLDDEGVVRLSGLAAFDADTPGENFPPFDPRTVATNDANFIVAYGWDLDSDGTIDRFGETIYERFPLNTPRDITLTVWDHQGATSAITRTIVPTIAQRYGDAVVNGAMNLTSLDDGLYALGSDDADEGWFANRAIPENGLVRLAGQFRSSGIAQAIYDDTARRGEHILTFDLAINNADQFNNTVDLRVYGINGEFGAVHDEAIPRQEGAIPVEIVTLLDERFQGDFPMTTFERTIELGPDGYDYLFIGFDAEGVSLAVANDHALLDNVALIGAPLAQTPACPGDCDNSGAVDFNDLVATLFELGSATSPQCDADQNGTISFNDLLATLFLFGDCPG